MSIESKTYKIIIVEWITIISTFLTCFVYMINKMEKQCDRTDRLYEMFIDLLKDKK